MGYARLPASTSRPQATAPETPISFNDWSSSIRGAVCMIVADFVDQRCAPQLRAAGIDVALDVLGDYVDGGKCLRSTFMYLGWRCGADDDDTALRAAASLELGAAMADCRERARLGLAGYGDAVGEAFQMRGDVLGIFGSPEITRKPCGGDLTERRATTVVAAAYHLADPPLRRQLRELTNAKNLDDSDIRRWQELIAATGAIDFIEQRIDSQLAHALTVIDDEHIEPAIRPALAHMAAACSQRAA